MQVASCYPDQTKDFASELSDLLDKHYAVLNSSLRQTLVKALILLRNRKQVTSSSLAALLFSQNSFSQTASCSLPCSTVLQLGVPFAGLGTASAAALLQAL